MRALSSALLLPSAVKFQKASETARDSSTEKQMVLLKDFQMVSETVWGS